MKKGRPEYPGDHGNYYSLIIIFPFILPELVVSNHYIPNV